MGGATWLLVRAKLGEARSPTITEAALSRGSSLAPLRPFDLGEFQADPEAYLRKVEPARCFQTAQPTGTDDVRLGMVTGAQLSISPGETVALKVKGVAFAPVTFTSFNGGTFDESKLGSVTVRANADGLAEAHFSVGPGIGGDVRIQAGSPLAVGAQVFAVRVRAR
jgi:hypothetical protein